MIRPGLVSISFRPHPVSAILDACAGAGLEGVEWGGDVHVPVGDTARARQVGRETRSRGLQVAAYGSYYRVGSEKGPGFDEVLASARALEAPHIRVWAGEKASAETTAVGRQKVLTDLWRICEAAHHHGITVGLEWHGGTLTDELESARDLLFKCPHPALRTLWQPPVGMAATEALVGLDAVVSRLSNLHVFYWWPRHERQALAKGSLGWMAFLRRTQMAPGDRWALLEFIPGDSFSGLKRDAETLRSWLDISANAQSIKTQHQDLKYGQR